MTTLELQGFANDRFPTIRLLGGLRRLFAPLKHWYDRRQTLLTLSRFDAHLLSDVGVEACELHDALEGRGSALWRKVYARQDIC